MTMFTKTFSDCWRSKYGMILSALFKKHDKTWQMITFPLLQEHSSMDPTKSASLLSNERAYVINSSDNKNGTKIKRTINCLLVLEKQGSLQVQVFQTEGEGSQENRPQ